MIVATNSKQRLSRSFDWRLMTAHSRGTIFDMVGFKFLDKAMQMVTTPGNHSYTMLEA